MGKGYVSAGGLPVINLSGCPCHCDIITGSLATLSMTGTIALDAYHLIGRGALDGLVIAPRICGICGLSHLTTAARTLDMAAGVDIPPNATRIRNLALMVELLQNDMRQSFLMFAPDLANPVYTDKPLFDEATRRYTPFKGKTVVDVIRTTKKLLEIVAIIGVQWPHTSFIVPGGISSVPSLTDLVQCRMLLQDYRKWYETRILGG